MNTATSGVSIQSVSFDQRIKAGLMALAIGTVMVAGLGFAHSSNIHNAAHDTRHAVSFPCH